MLLTYGGPRLGLQLALQGDSASCWNWVSTGHPLVTQFKRIKSDSMGVSALTHIVIDLSYRDAKRRSVLDIPETRDEVFAKILSFKGILQGIKAGKVQIVLF